MNDEFDFDIDNGASAGGGGFWKPADHKSAALVMIEPKGSRNSNKYKDEDGNWKQEAIADFTVFATAGELEAKQPGVVMQDGICSSGVLAKIIIEKGKGIIIGTLSQTPPKNGKQGYWKIDPVDPKFIPGVKAYLKDREQKKQDALPDFMKG